MLLLVMASLVALMAWAAFKMKRPYITVPLAQWLPECPEHFRAQYDALRAAVGRPALSDTDWLRLKVWRTVCSESVSKNRALAFGKTQWELDKKSRSWETLEDGDGSFAVTPKAAKSVLKTMDERGSYALPWEK